MLQFNNCTLSKKIMPLMPDGTYPKYTYGQFYKKQGKAKVWNEIKKLKKFMKPTKE